MCSSYVKPRILCPSFWRAELEPIAIVIESGPSLQGNIQHAISAPPASRGCHLSLHLVLLYLSLANPCDEVHCDKWMRQEETEQVHRDFWPARRYSSSPLIIPAAGPAISASRLPGARTLFGSEAGGSNKKQSACGQSRQTD